MSNTLKGKFLGIMVNSKLTPPDGLTQDELRKWINSNLNPDEMGFDDNEGITKEEIDEYNKLEVPLSKMMGVNSDISVIPFLTTINFTDNNRSASAIKYIVIHYTANKGDTAKANCAYFYSTYRGASAHYFVDENYIYQSVLDNDIAWHCGGGLQGSGGHEYHKICLNSNSIGIEMCTDYADGKYYISNETINNTIKLVKVLMDKYNIDLNHVIRHYDVTGKICPKPFVDNKSQWVAFKDKFSTSTLSSLAKQVQIKFGLSDETMTYLIAYEYAQALFEKLLAGVKIFSKSTIAYLKAYKYGTALIAKLGIKE